MTVREGILSDEIMACAELEQDPLFHKIPKDKIPYYVSTSLARGREAAAPYIGRDIRELCQAEGLRYEITNRSGTFHNVSFRAQIDFAKKTPEIIVYSASLAGMRQAYQEVVGTDAEGTELDRLIDIHLAHEFYHYLEYKTGKFTNEELEPIEVFRLGQFFVKRSSVVKTSEIAAHAFCKEVMGLPCLPNVLDYVYLIQSNTLSEEQFGQQVISWKSWM
ncbi:hypothetical protein SAMN05661091_4770 [Paenibacillus uliginis N3/975]|uniref:Uncharacterized protein n=1 Tax=Paenibacillus uliginis N3/975 TaxID=1313296 RepID=A0A1X7HNE4_9BACL|nr:hypothetical protein [Paenibacillus uliginis]SMF89771.1 hypothetical protein SAMN05661091_4770 [Paenibacillus uliginis N3/975]